MSVQTLESQIKSKIAILLKDKVPIKIKDVQVTPENSEISKMALSQTTMTITFGDQAENQKGMELIGKMAEKGFSIKDLTDAKKRFEDLGCKCELIDLNQALPNGVVADHAAVLIIRQGANFLDPKNGKLADDLFAEQVDLKWDTKAKKYGKVVNMHARYNLVYSDYSQEPNYQEGKGRIIAYKDIPATNLVWEKLPTFLGDKAKNLVAEGNKYYDVNKCYINFHGDKERKKVIALRLGATMPLYYQWFHASKPIGSQVKMECRHGDMYVMSEKATGYDWMSPKKVTLRHAASLDPKLIAIKAK